MNELLLDDFLNEHQNIVLGCDCLMGTASFLEGSKNNQLDFLTDNFWISWKLLKFGSVLCKSDVLGY